MLTAKLRSALAMLCGLAVGMAAGAAHAQSVEQFYKGRQVTMVVRADSLARSMSEYLIREIEFTPNLAVRLNTVVAGGHGGLSPHVTGTDGTGGQGSEVTGTITGVAGLEEAGRRVE